MVQVHSSRPNSLPRIMHGKYREILALATPTARVENHLEAPSVLLLLLLLSVDLAPSGTRLNTGDIDN